MAIEGLNNTYGVPVIKKERPAENKKKKKKDGRNPRDIKKDKKEEKKKDGRVDIRI